MATKKVATPKAEITAAKTTKKAAAPKVETPSVAEVPVATTPKKAAAKTTKVTFTLPAAAVQTAQNVAIVGEFNNWDILTGVALKKQKDGSFSTALELETGKEYQYRFLINGDVWENAWDAPKYVPTPFGTFNSVVFA